MSLYDDMLKHRIFVQRLAGTEAKSIKSYLDNLKEAAKREIAAGTTGRVLQEALKSSVKDLKNVAIENMADIAEYESRFAAKTYSKYFDKKIESVDREKLKSTILKTNIAVSTSTKKKSIDVAYSQFANRKSAEIVQIIKDAQLQNLDRLTTFKLVEERINGLHAAQADTLARTSVNYSTNVAKNATTEQNSDVIEKEIWVSTLESGTCDYCEGLHGTVFDVGDAPDCPAHWNCACEVIPYV